MITDWNMDEIVERVRHGAMVGVAVGISVVEDRAVHLIMNPPKTGRIYRRRGVEHQASKAGEAPANETGRLVNSRVVEFHEDTVSATLSFRTAYAMALEVGGKHYEARPYARRALTESRDQISAAISAGVAEALR